MAARLIKTSIAAALASFALADVASARTVELKSQIECSGAAVTLGDVFNNAGEMSGRAVAPAPAAGARTTFSARFLAAAAAAAGLNWAPPQGVEKITVFGAGAAQVQPASFSTSAALPAVKRGDTVTMVYVAPGVQLTTRAKAMGNGAIGDTIRFTNLQSNKIVEATITGPGAAAVRAAQNF